MHSSAVVAHLMESLPRGNGQHPIMYEVYMDNLFSSVALFKMLRNKALDVLRLRGRILQSFQLL